MKYTPRIAAHFPHPDETMYIGYFSNCVPAVEKAKRFYRRVTGCRVCSRHCATVAEEIVLR